MDVGILTKNSLWLERLGGDVAFSMVFYPTKLAFFQVYSHFSTSNASRFNDPNYTPIKLAVYNEMKTKWSEFSAAASEIITNAPVLSVPCCGEEKFTIINRGLDWLEKVSYKDGMLYKHDDFIHIPLLREHTKAKSNCKMSELVFDKINMMNNLFHLSIFAILKKYELC